MKRNFSVRLDSTLIDRLNRIAESYDTKPARIIEHALRIYTGLVEQNGGAMLSPAQLAQMTELFTKDARPEFTAGSSPKPKGSGIAPAKTAPPPKKDCSDCLSDSEKEMREIEEEHVVALAKSRSRKR